MTKFTATFASIAATLLLAGNAMAQMPASGEGPLFLNEGKTVSTVSRDTVRHDAVAQRPASGAFDGTTTARNTTSPSREAVRQEAIAHRPASGMFDGSTVAQQYHNQAVQAGE